MNTNTNLRRRPGIGSLVILSRLQMNMHVNKQMHDMRINRARSNVKAPKDTKGNGEENTTRTHILMYSDA